jgi:uncharacterized protein
MKILSVASAVCVLLGVSATATVAHPVEYDEYTFASIDCAKDFGPAVDTICKSSHLRYLDQEIAIPAPSLRLAGMARHAC